MARKKNPQPKRNYVEPEKDTSTQHHHDDDGVNKRRRFLDDERRTTTSIIPADHNDPILQEIPKFVSRVQQMLDTLKSDYDKAIAEGAASIDVNGWYRGYRKITGNRLEVKVLGEYMRSIQGFESLPEKLVRYAQRQAIKDERIHSMMQSNPVVFSEWSMIISENCDAQSIHIDVPENNFQFGLILNNGTKGTLVLRENIGPDTPKELVDKVWVDAPLNLRDCIVSNQSIHLRMQKLLDEYGPLLWPRDTLEKNIVASERLKAGGGAESKNKLLCGDLICTSGGIPHAGPACDHFRMVMFAAVSPTKHSLYNVDDQYFAHSAMLFCISIVWDSVDTASKIFLLDKLSQIVHSYGSVQIINHGYVSSAFTKLMYEFVDSEIADKECPNNNNNDNNNSTRKNEIIQKFIQEYGDQTESDLFQYRPI